MEDYGAPAAAAWRGAPPDGVVQRADSGGSDSAERGGAGDAAIAGRDSRSGSACGQRGCVAGGLGPACVIGRLCQVAEV